ncbi:mitochondrial import protein Pam17 [Dendrothele bispora CBS 962.96]|uniref:Presequence translocated-associated motor subunit PAM17 n=1 Tax=Dendrothele bispora (strain CBS 962.96) TaxID=1314807 RepID=A0A4S8MM50_DENBC|nr:mitochondrial import protein Pam17 [Dendrothele bispora CBS 962.96]
MNANVFVRSSNNAFRISQRHTPTSELLKHSARSKFKSTKAGNPSKPSGTTGSISEGHLSWPEYLNVRKQRRTWQNVMAIPTSLLGLIGGASYFGSLETDPTKPILGLDPFMAYGLGTVATMGLGYLVGPSIGNAIWRFSNRRVASSIDARDREFYKHIAKNRVDPSLQNPTSPIPDFYGEKIGSLSQYRQWLRDQAKYKKRMVLPED